MGLFDSKNKATKQTINPVRIWINLRVKLVERLKFLRVNSVIRRKIPIDINPVTAISQSENETVSIGSIIEFTKLQYL